MSRKVITVGQRYHELGQSEIYLLAQVGESRVVLIGLIGANRWESPVRVANPHKITKAEWRHITSRALFVLTEAT